MFRNYIKQCNGQVESVKRIVKKRDMSYPVSKFVLISHSERSAVMPSRSGVGDSPDQGLQTPNEGINQGYLKNWADVADKICFGRT